MNRSQSRLDRSAPTLTLFCGLPGAGKSTLARRLEAAGRGVRLSTDEWQATLGFEHTETEFHGRLQAVLYRHALALLRQGADVILEDGLWMTDERTQKFADAGPAALGLSCMSSTLTTTPSGSVCGVGTARQSQRTIP